MSNNELEILKSEIKILEDQLRKKRERIRPLIDEKNKQANQKLIGKCFSFLNSYDRMISRKKWFVYYKVISANEHSVRLLSIQNPPNISSERHTTDEIEIEIITREHDPSFIDDLIPITNDEFIKKLNQQIKMISEFRN